MHPIGILGPDEVAIGSVTDAVADRLSERGPTATVVGTGEEPAAEQSGAGDRTYRLADDGYTVTGARPTPRAFLERLAPEFEYAVFANVPAAEIPHVVVGDAEHAGSTLQRASRPDEVDVDAALEALASTEPVETLPSLVARAKASPEAPKSGAIATFTGRVRAKEHDDDEFTERLEFEQYDAVADDRFAQISDDLEAREGVFEAILHHRTGTIEYGEDIVFVVILAGHREEAFAAVEDGINRLKAEVPLFKKEITVSEEFWAHQ